VRVLHKQFSSYARKSGVGLWSNVPLTDVRFGSLADICIATSDVCFTPNSDHESGHPQTVMSALALKADMCGANLNVR